MIISLIKLTYRFIVDTNNTDGFSKELLRLYYEEFKIKSQAYNMEENLPRSRK